LSERLTEGEQTFLFLEKGKPTFVHFLYKSYYENLNIPLEQEGESEDTMEVLAQDAISEFTPILKTLHKFIEMWKNKDIELQYDPTVSRFFKIKFTNNTDFPREAVIDLEESNNKSEEDNVNG
jgi:hypothetical protein